MRRPLTVTTAALAIAFTAAPAQAVIVVLQIVHSDGPRSPLLDHIRGP